MDAQIWIQFSSFYTTGRDATADFAGIYSSGFVPVGTDINSL